jgi:hypothetical protein
MHRRNKLDLATLLRSRSLWNDNPSKPPSSVAADTPTLVPAATPPSIYKQIAELAKKRKEAQERGNKKPPANVRQRGSEQSERMLVRKQPKRRT